MSVSSMNTALVVYTPSKTSAEFVKSEVEKQQLPSSPMSRALIPYTPKQTPEEFAASVIAKRLFEKIVQRPDIYWHTKLQQPYIEYNIEYKIEYKSEYDFWDLRPSPGQTYVQPYIDSFWDLCTQLNVQQPRLQAYY